MAALNRWPVLSPLVAFRRRSAGRTTAVARWRGRREPMRGRKERRRVIRRRIWAVDGSAEPSSGGRNLWVVDARRTVERRRRTVESEARWSGERGESERGGRGRNFCIYSLQALRSQAWKSTFTSVLSRLSYLLHHHNTLHHHNNVHNYHHRNILRHHHHQHPCYHFVADSWIL
jgi:hypothetical protein